MAETVVSPKSTKRSTHKRSSSRRGKENSRPGDSTALLELKEQQRLLQSFITKIKSPKASQPVTQRSKAEDSALMSPKSSVPSFMNADISLALNLSHRQQLV